MDFADPTLWIILILVVIFSVVVYYEWKIIRRRRLDKDEAQIQVDDIYNQIITTQAVSRALKGQGANTKVADLALIEAEAAWQRRNYTEAKGATERAKTALKDVKATQDPLLSLASVKAVESSKPTEENLEVPFQEAKKLPPNFMESKFMISAVRDEIESKEKDGVETALAKDNLRVAEAAFEKQDYTGALKFALRAKRSLEPEVDICPPSKTKTIDLTGTEKIASTKVVRQGSIKCAFCNADLESDDLFCRKCGKKVELRILCPSCNKEVGPDDAFCRKCGMTLRS